VELGAGEEKREEKNWRREEGKGERLGFVGREDKEEGEQVEMGWCGAMARTTGGVHAPRVVSWRRRQGENSLPKRYGPERGGGPREVGERPGVGLRRWRKREVGLKEDGLLRVR
jgi:hypothetical protein